MNKLRIGQKCLLLSLLVSISTQQVMADMQSVITTFIGSAAVGAVLFVQPHYEKWLKHGLQEQKNIVAERAAANYEYFLLEQALHNGAKLSKLAIDSLATGEFFRKNTIDKLANDIHRIRDNCYYSDLSGMKHELKHNVSQFIQVYPILQALDHSNEDILPERDRKRFEADKSFYCRQVRVFGSVAESMCASYTELLNKIAEVRKQHGFIS